MPVHRLRTLDEADRWQWRDPDAPELWAAISELWRLSARLCPPCFPPGVHKHHAIEDANRQDEEWEQGAIERARR